MSSDVNQLSTEWLKEEKVSSATSSAGLISGVAAGVATGLVSGSTMVAAPVLAAAAASVAAYSLIREHNAERLRKQLRQLVTSSLAELEPAERRDAALLLLALSNATIHGRHEMPRAELSGVVPAAERLGSALEALERGRIVVHARPGSFQLPNTAIAPFVRQAAEQVIEELASEVAPS